MQPLHVYSVIPKLPERLQPLWELAYNLWFAWNGEIESIFSQVDPRIWRESYRNPVLFLNRVPQRTLEEMAKDELYVERLRETQRSLKQYLGRRSAPFGVAELATDEPVIAYFSLEYGISLCLPIYSGGLGVLAGDHLKSASDMNLPLVGVGLCYQSGYFRQYLTPDGWQQERYPDYDFEHMPLTLVKDKRGAPLSIALDLRGETLRANIWLARWYRLQVTRLSGVWEMRKLVETCQDWSLRRMIISLSTNSTTTDSPDLSAIM